MINRGLVLLLLAVPTASQAATLCVNPLGSGGCLSSIQQAVNAAVSGDLIDVAAGTYAENVVIGPPRRLTIQGAGSATVIDGNDLGPVIDVATGTSATLTGLRLEDGTIGIEVEEHSRLTLNDCEIADHGIGIRTAARSTTTITGCAITGNSGAIPLAKAAGIEASGRLTVQTSIVTGNSGVGIFSGDPFKLIESTVSDNTERGVVVFKPGRISRSTISGNGGGGISAQGIGTLRVDNSTISGNTASAGAGINSIRRLQLDHVTIAGNSATGTGGGLREDHALKVVIRSSIIADNTAPMGPDCFSDAVRAFTANLVEDPSSCTITVGTSTLLTTDPLLGPLQDNGGPTETQALMAGSPAIAVITARGACRAPDQRGVPRIVPCDLGAYEAP